MNMDLDNERRRAVEVYNSTPQTHQERRRQFFDQVKRIDSAYRPEDTSR
jgi:hypothetical protein